MQQRLTRRFGVEVTRFLPEHEIGHERSGSGDVFAKVAEPVEQKNPPPDDPAEKQYEYERGKYPANAPRIKICEAERSLIETGKDDAGDQEAGDYEENIDADEARTESSGKDVKQNDRKHRDRTQAVDIRPVLQRTAHARGPLSAAPAACHSRARIPQQSTSANSPSRRNASRLVPSCRQPSFFTAALKPGFGDCALRR